MRLVKFRIQNYKSIKDSGWCWLASDLTLLAGKNESGKSAILEALRDFNIGVDKIPEEALPLDSTYKPIIEMTFNVDKDILEYISDEMGFDLKDLLNIFKDNFINISKYHDGSYKCDKDLNSLIKDDKKTINNESVDKINSLIEYISEIRQLADIPKPKINSSFGEVNASINNYIQQCKRRLGSIPEQKRSIASGIFDELTEIKKSLEEVPKDSILESFLYYVPNFIFFSDFSDIIPFEIPLTDSKNHEAVKDFLKVANINIENVIGTTDIQRRKNILRDHSAILSGDFMEYWRQHEIKLVADVYGENLIICLEEEGRTQYFKVEQRSKGFQWFLSFYLRLKARASDINLILIDEPGLYLHAKAQKDVLNVLEKISQNTQVLFSTHSPYLIDVNRLDRVRLIIKDDEKGSSIENKIHKGADIETLTPIITAIGLDISHNLVIGDKQKNILLEGISDYYYLQAIKIILNGDEVYFIPHV